MADDKEKKPEPEKKKSESDCGPVSAEGAAVDAPCGEGKTGASTESSAPDPIEELKKEVASLKADLQAQKDSKLRLLAEFDNFKRRTARESIQLMECANEDLVKELIPVLENFERALDPAHKEKDIDAFYKGVELIYNLLNEKLKKAGLQAVDPKGEEFDAAFHEAVMHMASPDVPENKIAMVIQKGYKLNSKIIQYAKVAVSKGKE